MRTNDNTWLPMRVSDALADGIEACELRRKSCHHPYWGVVRSQLDEPDQPLTRILDALAVVRGAGAIGGWAAANRQGVRRLDGRRFGRELPVLLHVLPGHQVRPRPGIVPSRCGLLPGELESFDGDPVAALDRALYDDMRLAPNVTEAVIVLDMGVADLVDPVTGLVVESDGRQHREDEQLHTADNIREEGMEDANLTVVRVTGPYHRDPVAVGARVRRGYRRARARDVGRDRWTLVEPDWWPRSRFGRLWA